eukprot:m.629071 g.629071  ORF g.629071 m.629071 type:complete len:97 (-) comp58268_c2_seq4:1406-1696(-)
MIITVLKLDSTQYHVTVRTNATGKELKEAIQYHHRQEVVPIDWNRLWRRTSLLFKTQVIRDSDKLQRLGVKHGEAVTFGPRQRPGQKGSAREHGAT